jgi:hypothetical protein
MTFDGRTDFSFTEYSKYVVLYPVCDTRNSLRGEFLLQFDSVSDSESLIHVTVKVPDIVVVFSIFWLCGVSAFLFFSLLRRKEREKGKERERKKENISPLFLSNFLAPEFFQPSFPTFFLF